MPGLIFKNEKDLSFSKQNFSFNPNININRANKKMDKIPVPVTPSESKQISATVYCIWHTYSDYKDCEWEWEGDAW